MIAADFELEERLTNFVAESWYEELLDEVEKVRAKCARNNKKYGPSQRLLSLLQQAKYQDALRFLSATEEDPVEMLVQRLKRVKNPYRQGKGVKKAKHTRPNARREREPVQLILRVGVPGRHRKQNEKIKVKAKKEGSPNYFAIQLSLF